MKYENNTKKMLKLLLHMPTALTASLMIACRRIRRRDILLRPGPVLHEEQTEIERIAAGSGGARKRSVWILDILQISVLVFVLERVTHWVNQSASVSE